MYHLRISPRIQPDDTEEPVMVPDIILQCPTWIHFLEVPQRHVTRDETDVFISGKLRSYLLIQWIVSIPGHFLLTEDSRLLGSSVLPGSHKNNRGNSSLALRKEDSLGASIISGCKP